MQSDAADGNPRRSTQVKQVQTAVPDANTDDYRYKGIRIQTYPELHFKAAELVRKFVPPGSSVLDLAAGEGALSFRLKDQGYKVACTTWNRKVKASLPEVFVVNLDRDFKPADVGGREYQCVLGIEIVEHVENPAAFLRNVHALLADQGVFILSTPNIESAFSRIQIGLRGFPQTFSVEEVRKNRHISMLHRNIIEYFFEKAGLVIRERHFVPKETFKIDGLRALLRHALLILLRPFMQGEIEGACRVYVLVKGTPEPENSADFY